MAVDAEEHTATSECTLYEDRTGRATGPVSGCKWILGVWTTTKISILHVLPTNKDPTASSPRLWGSLGNRVLTERVVVLFPGPDPANLTKSPSADRMAPSATRETAAATSVAAAKAQPVDKIEKEVTPLEAISLGDVLPGKP